MSPREVSRAPCQQQVWEGDQVDLGRPFPITVALGADPATILRAVTPVPDSLSEELPAAALNDWEMALEGPYGDHTGYDNEQDWFPVFAIDRITLRNGAIYHATYTGKPPDEPAILGVALNEVFVPILSKQFNEITDLYLPPEGCSYRMAVVSKKTWTSPRRFQGWAPKWASMQPTSGRASPTANGDGPSACQQTSKSGSMSCGVNWACEARRPQLEWTQRSSASWAVPLLWARGPLTSRTTA